MNRDLMLPLLSPDSYSRGYSNWLTGTSTALRVRMNLSQRMMALYEQAHQACRMLFGTQGSCRLAFGTSKMQADSAKDEWCAYRRCPRQVAKQGEVRIHPFVAKQIDPEVLKRLGAASTELKA